MFYNYQYPNNLYYVNNMNNSSYIYIIRNLNDNKCIYKIGKTNSKEKTILKFNKYPIRKAFRPVDKSLADYVLNMIFVILGPYRTFKKDGINLDNSVEIEKNILVAIIENIITRASKHRLEVRLNYIPKNIASSRNCRKKIPKIYWHQFCENIDETFPNLMPIPMDIDNEPKILFDESYFDDFILNYHDSFNIKIMRNDVKIKDNHPKSSIKHYFQPSSLSQQPVYQNSLAQFQKNISTPITNSNLSNFFYNQGIGNLFNTNTQTAATSLAWNTPTINPTSISLNNNNLNNICNNWNQQMKII